MFDALPGTGSVSVTIIIGIIVVKVVHVITVGVAGEEDVVHGHCLV